jgi:hypothetical protein
MNNRAPQIQNELSLWDKYSMTIKIALTITAIVLLFLAFLSIRKYYNKIKAIERAKIEVEDVVGTYLGDYGSFKGTRLEIYKVDSIKGSRNDSIPLAFSIVCGFKIIKNDTLYLNIKDKTIWSKNKKFGHGNVNRNHSRKIVIEAENNNIQWHYKFYKRQD